VADETLKRAISELGVGSFLKSRRLVMHPLEMVDGGVSEVEERVLLELAGSDASKAVVWVGRELADSEVQEKLR
jgi:rod shape-determining protein MreB